MKIGFYDSGLGGLTVLSKFIARIPNNEYFYLGDNENAPYGDKTKAKLQDIFKQNMECFFDSNVKDVVLACNTMSTTLLKWARKEYKGINFYPITPLVDYSRLDNKCYVFCTVRTAENFIKDKRYKKNKDKIKVIPCSGLVQLIEAKNVTFDELVTFLPKNEEKVGQVVLGCTHYEIIKCFFERYYPDAYFTDNVNPIIEKFSNSDKRGTISFLGKSKEINAYSFPNIYKKINKNGFFFTKVVDNYHKWLYNIITTTKKGGF